MSSVLFYVQHLMGIGHLKRTALLAKAVEEAGFSVTLVSGGFPVSGLDRGGVEFVQLPSARAADETFRLLLDENGNPVDDHWRGRRRERLEAVFDRVGPDVFVLEMFPFGRRQFHFELLPLLERAARREPRAKIVCSVRDILVTAPAPERYEEMAGLVERFFDRVLVHGDPELISFEQTFPLYHRIAGKLQYTGYVVEPPPPAASHEGTGGVLVSAGSREKGEPLLAAALAARSMTSLAEVPWRLLAGLNFPPDALRRLKEQAPPGVRVEPFRSDFTRLLARASLCISQGGYNTTLEVLAAGIPAVLAPHGGGRDTEQPLRARLLAARGAVAAIGEGEALTPQSLAKAVERAIALGLNAKRGTRGTSPLRMDGARETADIIAGLLHGG